MNNLEDAEYLAAAVKRSKKVVAFSRSDLFKKKRPLDVSGNTLSSHVFERFLSIRHLILRYIAVWSCLIDGYWVF